MLLIVSDVTNKTNQELPFFLYDKESNNNIEFTEFVSTSQNHQNTAVSFNQTMLNNQDNRIKRNQNTELVICHEHSNTPIGNIHQNFSLRNFTSYI